MLATITQCRTAILTVAAMGLYGSVSPAVHAEIIDRILAVVDGEIITLSDAHAVLRFRLVPPEVSTDPVEPVMRRLIDRRLMLNEVERYAVPEPPAAAVDTRVAEIRGRFKDELAFEVALNQTALSREELRRYIRDSLRIDLYLQQRFASVADPSEDDIVRYYKEHAPDFTANGVQLSFEQARAQVRERVVDERQRQAIADWLEGLRRRSVVSVLYLPGR